MVDEIPLLLISNSCNCSQRSVNKSSVNFPVIALSSKYKYRRFVRERNNSLILPDSSALSSNPKYRNCVNWLIVGGTAPVNKLLLSDNDVKVDCNDGVVPIHSGIVPLKEQKCNPMLDRLGMY